MQEPLLFISGFATTVVLASVMGRIGCGRGGLAWALGWACLLLSGVSNAAALNMPSLAPLVPIFSTVFAALLVDGAARFTLRATDYRRPLIAAAVAVATTRILIQPVISPGVSQILGTLVITTAVLTCCHLLLNPPGRPATNWDRGLAIAFPSVAIVSVYYAWCQYFEIAAPPSILAWNVAGIMLGSLKIGAFISIDSENLEAYRQEVERSREQTEAFEAHYRLLMDHAPDLIAELSEDGTILYANPAHIPVLGVDPADVVGQPGNSIQMSPSPDSLDTSVFEMDGSAPRRQIFIATHKDDGRLVTLECGFYQFRHSSGERRTVVTSRDITDRAADDRHREEVRAHLAALVASRTEELRASLRQLEESQRLAALGTMAAGIAHQINNPIGSIQMGAEFALGTPSEDAERERTWREALENAVEQSQRCGQIVSNMLQFARDETTKKGPEDLAAILCRACDETQQYATSLGASIDRLGLDRPIALLGSAIELEQVFLNVLRNACESSESGAKVTVSVETKSDQAIVRIRDDGRGMAPSESARAFDPFFTTRLGVGGTGLGMSVAHRVIEDHQGSLHLDSRPGSGTTVEIRLPLQAGEFDAAET